MILAVVLAIMDPVLSVFFQVLFGGDTLPNVRTAPIIMKRPAACTTMMSSLTDADLALWFSILRRA